MITLVLTGILMNANALYGASGSMQGSADSIVSAGHEIQRMERLDESKLKDLVQHRRGRALLINVWATWCGPCVEEFPDLVRLANEVKNRNIDIVGVSGDDFDDELTKVVPFIEREKASFKFYIAKLEGEDKFIEAFDKKWGGGIPATFLYDSHGENKGFLLGKQTYRSLKSAVEKIVDH